MKDSSISKYHLFSGVSVMVIAYLTLTTVVLYLKCFKLYVPDFLDALRTQGMSANMYSDLFLIVFPAVILLLLYVVSFHFSYGAIAEFTIKSISREPAAKKCCRLFSRQCQAHKRHRLDTGSFQNLQHSHRYGGYTNWVNE